MVNGHLGHYNPILKRQHKQHQAEVYWKQIHDQ